MINLDTSSAIAPTRALPQVPLNPRAPMLTGPRRWVGNIRLHQAPKQQPRLSMDASSIGVPNASVIRLLTLLLRILAVLLSSLAMFQTLIFLWNLRNGKDLQHGA